jgi:hypothetical protein
MGLKSPHLLLASSNSRKMLANLCYILDATACTAIENEINKNTKLLFDLGESHYLFAKQLSKQHWRQRISRFYYGAYNIRRAVSLHENGSYGTEVDDHKKTQLPDTLNNASTYKNRLGTLRDDRNLSDYDHIAIETDLVFSQDDTEIFVRDFMNDVRIYLLSKGLSL